MPGRNYVRIALLVLGMAAVATKSSSSGNPLDDTADKTARAARLEEMRILAAKLSFEEPGTTPVLRHMVVEEPLLHFSDADRGLFDGTLWAYGREGRPVAFVEMYCGREISPQACREQGTAFAPKTCR